MPIGEKIRVSLFGQSHAPAIGALIEGLPAGLKPDEEQLRAFMARRAPGQSDLTTPRKEKDQVKILSGLNDKGETCGAPLCLIIENTDVRSGDYERFRDVPRPSHADYPASVKYEGHNDLRGGGQYSARMTAPLCAAGALCLQLLAQRGVAVRAHILQVGSERDAGWPEDARMATGAFPTLDEQAGARMAQAIREARAAGDSLGGIVEARVDGLPIGLGGAYFDGLEGDIARALFGIPAVRGVEFGEGFRAAAMYGSEHNDEWTFAPDGTVTARTNHAGGIVGGMTTGLPVIVRAAFKPTPTISRPQLSVSLSEGRDAALAAPGRHDPCVAVRAVPVVEAALAIVLADRMAREDTL